MTMNSRRNRRRGVILVIALWALAALSLLVLGLAYRLRLEGRIVRYRARRGEMLELARGAVALGIARIVESGAEHTFYGQPWAEPVVLDEAHFGDLASHALKQYRVEAMVFDEQAKLNVNYAGRGAITSLDYVEDEIAGAIQDWTDSDDAESEFGAEDRYYQGLAVPIYCKNAPMESIYELLVLPGVTGELFHGRSSNAMIPLDVPRGGYRPTGLRDLLTVYGTRRSINLNTAWPQVLLTIPGLDPGMIDNILYYRAGPDGVERTADDRAIKDFAELEGVGGFTEFGIAQARMYCVLTSGFFSIRVRVASRNSSARLDLDVEIERGDEGLKIVSWRER